VLEEVSEPGFPWFDFVPGAGADDCVIRDNVRIVEGNGNNFQAVFQHFDFVVIGKNLGSFEERWDRQDKKQDKGSGSEFSHFKKTSFLNLKSKIIYQLNFFEKTIYQKLLIKTSKSDYE